MPISQIDEQDTDARIKMNALIDAVNGLPAKATLAEARAGADDGTFVTPAGMEAHHANRLANQGQTNEGTNETHAVTPARLSQYVTNRLGNLNKGAVGLGEVNNTSDADKPISTATAAALAGKAPATHTHPAIAIADSTPAGRTLITGANAAAQRTALGLGTAAMAASSDFAPATHSHTAIAISDSTPAGRTLITAANAGAQRVALGLGTAAFAASADFAPATHSHTAIAISDSTPAGRTLITAANAGAQRIALGLGSAAMTEASVYATAAQGAKADSAIQPGNAALTDAREWTGATVTQAEAEAGIATTRRAWSAERVRQAAAAVVAPEVAARTELAGVMASAGSAEPGLAPSLFTSSLTGKGAATAPIGIGVEAASDIYGTVWRLAGADFAGPFFDAAPRRDMPIRDGRIYRVRMALERQTDPVDPLSDGVELRVQNLNKNHAHLSNVRIGGAHAVTVEGGPLEVAFTMSRNPPDGVTVDYEPPTTTRYSRPHFRIYGGAPQVVDLAFIEVEDVTVEELLLARLSRSESVAIADLAIAPAAFEPGQPGVRPLLTWRLEGSAEVDTLVLTAPGEGSVTLAKDAETYTASAAVTADRTYTLTVTDTLGRTQSRSATVALQDRFYWGTTDDPASADGAEIAAFVESALGDARQRTLTWPNPSGKYVAYAYPANWGAPSLMSALGPITFDMRTVSVTNAYGHTEDYRLISLEERQFGASATITVE